MQRLLWVVLLVLLASVGTALASQPKVGDAVWAQWRPNAWYQGKVARVCELGHFIHFNDGDRACVPTSLIAKDVVPTAVKVGDRVLADWRGKQYPAVVAGSGYHIRFDDHYERQKVPVHQLRKLAAAPTRRLKPKVGSAVWVQWKPNAVYRGKVAKRCSFGLYVHFDDGDKGCFSPAVMAVDKPPKKVGVGARVFGRWQGRGFYPGTVQAPASNGALMIHFDDSDRGAVAVHDLRLIGF